MQYDEILKRLKSLSNPRAVEGMAKYGITAERTYGVSIPNLRKIAQETRKNHALAQQLWESNIRETKILASMIDNPELVTEKQRLAFKDKKASDELFEKFFPIIKKESTDNRILVKKAVNWALRQIGKRNLNLNKKAIETAKEIQKTGSKSAKWIASYAIRELTSEAIQERLRK